MNGILFAIAKSTLASERASVNMALHTAAVSINDAFRASILV